MAHRLCNRLGRHLSCRQSFPRISAASSAKQDIFLHDLKRQELASHIVPARLLTKSRPFSSLTSGQSKRLFSSFNGNSGSFLVNPSYQVYGEEIAFTVKCIMPTFRVVGKRTVVMDKANAGRLLLEFTPRMANDNRFAWDSSIKFALSAEEVGTLVAHLTHGQPLELARQTAQGGGNQQYGFHDNKGVGSLQKVLRVMPENGGMAVTMSIDYEVDGRKGQDPPNPQEAVSIRLCRRLIMSAVLC